MSFRVKINLSKFFSDERKTAFVFVDSSNYDNIKDLEDHIINLFEIDDKIYLTTEDGTLLPQKESISIILKSDVLVAHNRHNTNIGLPAPVPAPKENRKRIASAVDEADIESSINESTEIRKKRKRKRQKKRSLESSVPSEEIEPEPIRKRVSTSNKAIKSHIRFDEEMPESSSSFRTSCYVNKTPRVVRALVEESVTAPVEELMATSAEEIKEFSPDVLPKSGSESDEVNKIDTDDLIPPPPIVETNGYHHNGNSSLNGTNGNESSLETLRQNSDSLNLPSLTEIPKENDVILFKYLRLGQNYIPEISSPIIGMVETVDRENKNLKIYILAGNEDLKNPDGKFSMSNGEDEATDSSSLLLNWSELIDPKEVKI